MATYGTTAIHALRKLLGGNQILDVDAGFDALASDIDPKLTPWSTGLLSARPAFGKAGRRYYATDDGVEYVDTGTAWRGLRSIVGRIAVSVYIDNATSVSSGSGFSVVRNGAGDYTVTFTKAFPTPPAVVATIDWAASGPTATVALISGLTSSTVQVITKNSAGTNTDCGFAFHASAYLT